jgi:hypothetical protein
MSCSTLQFWFLFCFAFDKQLKIMILSSAFLDPPTYRAADTELDLWLLFV